MNHLERINLLLGEKKMKKLQDQWVLVVGVGGVGSYACESLARSGIGNLVIVDKDTIASSNLNRQLQTNFHNIGHSKVQEMKKRIGSFSNCNVVIIEDFYNKQLNDCLFQYPITYVLDCIDTISCKADLIESCVNLNIPIISCMGMANRNDVTKIHLGFLHQTSYCPVARILRKKMKDLKIRKKIRVVHSSEQPFKQYRKICEQGNRKQQMPPASLVFTPAVAGLMMANFVVQEVIK